MLRSYAVSLGALAMGLVVLRGAYHRELASTVAAEAILAMLVFMGIGAVAGWIAEHLLQDSIEQMFRARVKWYREGMIEAGYIEPDAPGEE